MFIVKMCITLCCVSVSVKDFVHTGDQYVIHENHWVYCYYRTTEALNGSIYTHQLFISRKNAHPAGFSWLGSSNFWNSEIKTSLSVVPMELNCWSSLPSSSLSTSMLNFNQIYDIKQYISQRLVRKSTI